MWRAQEVWLFQLVEEVMVPVSHPSGHPGLAQLSRHVRLTQEC
jgi:hypothetical protein